MAAAQKQFNIYIIGNLGTETQLAPFIPSNKSISTVLISSHRSFQQNLRKKPPHVVLVHMASIPSLITVVLQQCRKFEPQPECIAMNNAPAATEVVQMMQQGASNFIDLNKDANHLWSILEKLFDEWKTTLGAQTIHAQTKAEYDIDSFIGQDDHILELKALIRKIVKSKDIPIMIRGETGTGKELLARIIHYQSTNGDLPFIEINCSAIPENLLESELFGYEPGAFTDAKVQKKGLFELAEGGTLFLDEIGLMSTKLQAKLLKVIEDKTFRRLGGIEENRVRVRIIAATNINLEQSIREGTFREDLYYRLNLISIRIPPLRERGEDSLLLASHFLKKICTIYGSKKKKMSPILRKKLVEHPWYGNVRELRNAIERSILLSEGMTLEAQYVITESVADTNTKTTDSTSDARITIRVSEDDMSLQTVEKELIKAVLREMNGNKNQTARLLNISRPRLVRKIREYNL